MGPAVAKVEPVAATGDNTKAPSPAAASAPKP
eukprot:CAMPEP_0172484510 /NCGR_PEP_ID=MMETSP1066-20121228/12010_1 /TAXON_ID=671091 /ORGANISM="Coscinodiscus wailesii, Strain CCMP2513" /LENGTH=31 /DNA_ID= /DNA_START= /DNA_END= /DNA_ORIENTATION=